MYDAAAWNNISDMQYTRLQCTQNKILRLVTNTNRYNDLNELYETIIIPRIKDVLRRQADKFFTHDYLTTTLTNDIKEIPDGLRRVHKYLHPID